MFLPPLPFFSLQRCLPMAILLLSPWSVQLDALAVPMAPISSETKPTPSQDFGGPRRPGPIPASSTLGPVDLTHQRGRPVPGVSGSRPAEATLAETGADPIRIR